MLERTVLETCHLVLDRPPQGDPYALVYVAEARTNPQGAHDCGVTRLKP